MESGSARGFTLIELVVATTVAAILAATAIPGMVAMVANNRSAIQSNEIVGALVLARSEAVTRAQQVSVCARQSGADQACAAGGGQVAWEEGWLVFVDASGAAGTVDEGDEVIRIYPALDDGNELKSATVALSFQETGFLNGAGATLALRPSKCYGSSNRDITVSKTGRASVSHVAC